MVKHIVLFKLKDEVSAEEVEALAGGDASGRVQR